MWAGASPSEVALVAMEGDPTAGPGGFHPAEIPRNIEQQRVHDERQRTQSRRSGCICAGRWHVVHSLTRKRHRIRMNINDEYVTLTAPIFDTPVIYLDRTATNISSNYGEASCRILLPFHVCSQIHIDKYHCQTDLYVITLFRKYIGLPE